MASSWWRPDLNDKGLSQGDVIRDLPFAISVDPPTRLKKSAGKGGVESWNPTARSSKGGSKQHYLFEGKEAPGLVVSHSCDLDKPVDRSRVLVAPVRPITALESEFKVAQGTADKLAGDLTAARQRLGTAERAERDQAAMVGGLETQRLVLALLLAASLIGLVVTSRRRKVAV